MMEPYDIDAGTEDRLDLQNEPNFAPQSPTAREYVATSKGDGTDDNSVVSLIVERKPLYPVRQGVIRGMPEDGGTLRNRLDMEHEQYGSDAGPGEDKFGNRIYALTVVNAGPPYSQVIQHVMQENAESFSVHDAQTEPWAYDTAATLPYTEPLNAKVTPVGIAPDYEQLL